MTKIQNPDAPAEVKTRKAPEARIYLGPSRPYGKPVFKGAVFHNGIPAFCACLFQQSPHFAACFVPTAKTGRALQDLANPKSALSKAAAKVALESKIITGD
ncbi:MAG: hypothetical protein LBD82_05250 [Deltaproteobacteria bacterium]|jgi:hypothetical protein|nr:hypothetical protein [Deltaproteobacteria bacterium]